MQYFKHFTKMRNDTKLKRVFNRYGIEGYGIYCLILEHITEDLCTESAIPELKETCEDLAEFYNGNTARINEIVSFMINNDLFELSEITGRVTCNKLYKYLDSSQTRSDAIRGLIKSWKSQAKELENGDCRDIIVSETVLDKRDRLRQDKTRQEEDKDIGVISEFIKIYFSRYNKEYLILKSPDNSDRQHLFKLYTMLNGDTERFARIVESFFTDEYWFTKSGGKRSHYLKSLVSHIQVIIDNIESCGVDTTPKFTFEVNEH